MSYYLITHQNRLKRIKPGVLSAETPTASIRTEEPYGGAADLISVLEGLKLLRARNVALQETNMEWHNKGYRGEFQKLLVKAFGAARV
jgi:hypothetical protein